MLQTRLTASGCFRQAKPQGIALFTAYPPKACIKDAGDVSAQMDFVRDESREFLVVFYLNTRLRLIGREVLHVGGLNSCPIDLRSLFKKALLNDAASIVLSHNHPSGDCAPSREDRKVTRRVSSAGDMLGIPLHDHVIVSRTGFRSLRPLDK